MPIPRLRSLLSIEPTIWALIAAGIITLAAALAIHLSWRSVVSDHISLRQELADTREQLITAHLWFEEALAGDRSIDIEMIWRRFEVAQNGVDRFLSKVNGESGGPPSRAAAPDLQGASDLRSLVLGMHEIARERWKRAPTSGAGTPIDQRFDEIFEDALREVVRADDDLKHHFGLTLTRQEGLLYVTLSIWLTVLAGLVGVFALLVGMRRRAAVEKVKLQEQLWQAQKFDAIGQLAGGIAHDFNNLLLAIIGYSDLLRSKLPADDQAQKDMDAIRKAAEQAASLTHQLLAFARRQVLQPRILDLSEVIGELQPMLRRLISEQIEIDFSLDPMLGAVRADPSQIGQVVVNLAVNARDAMPDGGRLRIETANIELGVDQARRLGIEPGRHVRTTVSDSGCGLEDLVKPYIFDPFFTTKKPGRGSGLGLSTVHGIVTQSNGAIDVKSNPGEGTSFHIYLPRVARAPEAAEEQEKPGDDSQAAAASETVLLVEDQDAVRTLVRQVMSSAGYRLLEAGAGEEALEVAARFDDTIHLLLTDVVLPGMAGPDLARKLQVLRPTMRVLFMTGHAQEAKQREALSEIGDGLLQKPFPPNLLTKKVREILHAQAAARAIE